jgi:hypothetical protein
VGRKLKSESLIDAREPKQTGRKPVLCVTEFREVELHLKHGTQVLLAA